MVRNMITAFNLSPGTYLAFFLLHWKLLSVSLCVIKSFISYFIDSFS